MNPRFSKDETVVLVRTGQVGKVLKVEYSFALDQYTYTVRFSDNSSPLVAGTKETESGAFPQSSTEDEVLLEIVKFLPTTIGKGEGWGKEWSSVDCIAFYSVARRMRRAGISLAEIEYLLTRMYKEVVEEEARQNKEEE